MGWGDSNGVTAWGRKGGGNSVDCRRRRGIPLKHTDMYGDEKEARKTEAYTLNVCGPEFGP